MQSYTPDELLLFIAIGVAITVGGYLLMKYSYILGRYTAQLYEGEGQRIVYGIGFMSILLGISFLVVIVINSIR